MLMDMDYSDAIEDLQVQSDTQKLIFAWKSEKCSPTLLPFESALVDSMARVIETQVIPFIL